MQVTMLGSGASPGVPLIGCECAVCTSTDPKNKRSRVSLHLQTDEFALLVDASPDLREQALRNQLRRVDAVFFTHAHADHCHGIDDLRSFNFLGNKPVDCYADTKTMQELQERFAYTFMPPTGDYGWFRTCLLPQPVAVNETVQLGPWQAKTFHQTHGHTHSLGLRIGDFAYSTDVNILDEAAFAVLEGVDTWIVDCLRFNPAPTHAHLDLALEWIARVKPRRAILTHMSHDFDYELLSASLPSNVEPGYDGLTFTL